MICVRCIVKCDIHPLSPLLANNIYQKDSVRVTPKSKVTVYTLWEVQLHLCFDVNHKSKIIACFQYHLIFRIWKPQTRMKVSDSEFTDPWRDEVSGFAWSEITCDSDVFTLWKGKFCISYHCTILSHDGLWLGFPATQPKSYMLSLTNLVWEFWSNALWGTQTWKHTSRVNCFIGCKQEAQ